jgi:hypothetical protein
MSTPNEARRRVDALISSTKTLIRRDPEQEVQGEGLAVAAAAVSAVKAALPGDVVVDATTYGSPQNASDVVRPSAPPIYLLLLSS